ncbi:hypothetical protein E3N88_13857 [Mikania micrantha]|uniref:Uncharacterized protein n=1 Tax=Mikania micrantha TaxID=192012 RepID=A0A5N6P107_9ASTR|nr:hypothetical protein E3N88_13857 [Mikania micrantha]
MGDLDLDVAVRAHVDICPELPHTISDVSSRPTYSLKGHTYPILTVDFWPRHSNIVCSGDTHGEARYLEYRIECHPLWI